MAGITGTAAYIKFGTTTISTDYRSFSTAEEMALVDQSAGADTYRSYLTTLTDGSGTMSIVIQSEDTATWGAVAPGTEATLEWGEEGTAAGKPKHTVNAIIESREKTLEYADLVVADISFKFSGTPSDTTYS